MNSILTMGVDIGSSASKCIILQNGEDIVSKSVVAVGAGTSGPGRAMDEALAACGKSAGDIAFVCATGYGRNSVKEANKEVSELSCHARGAVRLFAGVRTLIDIGGQDVKAMQISEQGMLVNFVMNDKCAAGTGRFLDVMSRVLEVKLSEMASLGAKATKSVKISSTCTVFAESEVISHLASGVSIPDIIDGIHHSIASKTAGLVKRVGVTPLVAMTGGVAADAEVVRILSEELHTSIQVSPLSVLCGALGAALYAYDSCSKKS